MKYDHLTIENLPYKPVYFSPASKRCWELFQHSIAYISVIIVQIKLKFVNGSYF